MAYMGSEAQNLDNYREANLPQEAPRPLRTLEGAGADAQARAGVSVAFLQKLAIFGVALVVVSVLSVARVGVFAAAASILQTNSSIRSELKEARTLEDDLLVQRSILSSASRIDRIATQSYGMVKASETEQMVAGANSATYEAEQAQAAADAEAQAEADAAAAEEQAAAEAEAAKQEAADQMAAVEQTQGDGSTAGANAADVEEL